MNTMTAIDEAREWLGGHPEEELGGTHGIIRIGLVRELLQELDKCASTTSTDARQTGEQCAVCGRQYEYVYRVPDDVWAKITPSDNPEGGLLCIDCASKRAEEMGITLRFHGKVEWWDEDNLDELSDVERQEGGYPATREELVEALRAAVDDMYLATPMRERIGLLRSIRDILSREESQ
jgi:hypothetical protein